MARLPTAAATTALAALLALLAPPARAYPDPPRGGPYNDSSLCAFQLADAAAYLAKNGAGLKVVLDHLGCVKLDVGEAEDT